MSFRKYIRKCKYQAWTCGLTLKMRVNINYKGEYLCFCDFFNEENKEVKDPFGSLLVEEAMDDEIKATNLEEFIPLMVELNNLKYPNKE